MDGYRYKEVETILAKLHGGATEALGAFRGRLVHFQKVGIAPSSPGRGKKILYSFEDVAIWAFCLQLAEFGIDPMRIAAIKDALWSQVSPYLLGDNDDEFLCAVLPSMLSRDLIEKAEQPKHKNSAILPLDGGDRGFEVVFRNSDLSLQDRTRALVINLSQLRRRLTAALPAQRLRQGRDMPSKRSLVSSAS